VPASVVSTGLPTLVLPVRELDSLRRARPDPGQLGTALAEAPGRPVTLYVVSHEAEGHWRARCFTPLVAGGEDAATGSAAGPLAAFAERFFGEAAIDIDQGIEMGSPSRLSAACDRDRVVVSGAVQLIGTGEVRLPVGSS